MDVVKCDSNGSQNGSDVYMGNMGTREKYGDGSIALLCFNGRLLVVSRRYYGLLIKLDMSMFPSFSTDAY